VVSHINGKRGRELQNKELRIFEPEEEERTTG
jgi:hypothetical protein